MQLEAGSRQLGPVFRVCHTEDLAQELQRTRGLKSWEAAKLSATRTYSRANYACYCHPAGQMLGCGDTKGRASP